MELSQAQYKTIQRYLEGEMSEAEEGLFIQQVEADELLREHLWFEFEMLSGLQPAIKAGTTLLSKDEPATSPLDPSRLKKLIAKAGADWQNEPKKKSEGRVVRLNYWWAAAAGILVIGLSWIFFSKTEKQPVASGSKTNEVVKDSSINIAPADSIKKSNEPETKPDYTAIAKKYYRKEKAPANKPELLAYALDDYDDGNYKTLQDIDMENLPQLRGPEDDKINQSRYVKELGYYYKGLSYVESGKATRALPNLTWLTKNAKDEALVTKANWHLALIYLGQKNDSLAIPLLRLVAGSEYAAYSGKAGEILRVLQ